MIYDPLLIEQYFHTFMKELPSFLPEGATQVDIDFLEKLDLLKIDQLHEETTLTRYFYVMESQDKITLVNDQFIIWIVPDSTNQVPNTLVLIALNHEGIPQLELAYVTSDIYNSSKLVLRILEKLLHEIQENEDSLKPYHNNHP